MVELLAEAAIAVSLIGWVVGWLIVRRASSILAETERDLGRARKSVLLAHQVPLRLATAANGLARRRLQGPS